VSVQIVLMLKKYRKGVSVDNLELPVLKKRGDADCHPDERDSGHANGVCKGSQVSVRLAVLKNGETCSFFRAFFDDMVRQYFFCIGREGG
jgi:hypothetical protein